MQFEWHMMRGDLCSTSEVRLELLPWNNLSPVGAPNPTTAGTSSGKTLSGEPFKTYEAAGGNMPDERSLFQTTGPSWSERASLGGLQAILMQPDMRRNLFLHGLNTFGAECALRYFPRDGKII